MKLRNKLIAIAAALMLVLPMLLTGCNSSKDDLYYKYDYDLSEYITLGEYKGLPIISSKIEVTQEEIDMQVQALLVNKGQSENIPENQALAEGDTVIYNCVVTMDGVEIPDLQEEAGTFVLGVGHYGEAIDNVLIGAKQGDKVTAERTLDESFGTFAGKTVTYDITVLGGYNMILPAYTDAFVKAFYGFATIAEFEEDLYNRMLEFRRENQYTYQVIEAWNMVMENATVIKYPEDAMAERVDYYIDTARSTAFSIGMNYEDYLYNVYGVGEEEFKAGLEEQAQKEVKEEMLIYAIARAEKLSVSDERYEEYLDRFIEQYDDFMYHYEIENTFGKELLRSEVLKEVVKEYILESADITVSE